jgi:DNA-binding protein YbaB
MEARYIILLVMDKDGIHLVTIVITGPKLSSRIHMVKRTIQKNKESIQILVYSP